MSIQKVNLATIAKILPGFGFPKKYQGRETGKYPFYKVGDISKTVQSGRKIMDDADNYIGDETLKEIKAKVIPQNTVVFAKIGEALKLNRRAITSTTSIIDNNVVGVFADSNKVLPLFLYYFFLKTDLTKLSRATTVPSVRKTDLELISVLLPNLDVQQKIVDKIEELFSVIGHNTGSLKSTKKTLINLRRKILDHAFKGKLTKEFADSGFSFDTALQSLELSRKKIFSSFKKGKYKQASSKVRKVNSKWLEIPLEAFGLVETGATPLRGNAEYWKNGTIPWVTSTVVNHQKVTEASELITDKALRETNTKLFPFGTLLVAMYGEGKTRGKVSELMIEAATNQALAGVILSEEAEQYKEFIKLYLYKNYEDLRRLASGGVQPNLNLTMIKEMQIPFPTKKEQLVIVDILNRYLSIIDNALTQIDQILSISNGTKQSILKQAFEGKLV